MRVRAGYEILYDFPQPTPMMVMLSIHHQHVSDLIVPDQLVTDRWFRLKPIAMGSETGARASWRLRED